ncbi:MAG TPA: histidinol-phosphate transaminase [Bacteroidia bacterium]|jgi:histidinol-phosphate aminotransferase|nr:histidinol-phosphate transaminase [Bacteroidia bacterium]
MFKLKNLLRENIRNLVPYSSAREEYTGNKGTFLDANENPFGSPLEGAYNRYPDPWQQELKKKIGEMKQVAQENIFLGNGSDEAIDILCRAFGHPGKDQVIVCPPTYGMYEVAAQINDLEVIRIPLLGEIFQLDKQSLLAAINPKVKLIFLCCPNNPTGNGVKWADIKELLERFDGLVVVDEAYIQFASYRSLIPELVHFPNLVILQTLSKSWGLASLRLGMAFASVEIIEVFNKIKAPYNVSGVSQQLAVQAIGKIAQMNEWVRIIVSEREKMVDKLSALSFVLKVYPSQANFLLVKMKDAASVYDYLSQNKIIVRDRSQMQGCEGCLRISIGKPDENSRLMDTLMEYQG